MQHGLTPQLVCFERRLIDGTWKLVTHGDNVAAGVFYDSETTNRVKILLADAAWYIVFCQVLTGGQTTRLEITNPTVGLIWAIREWTRTNFPQINALTVVSPGTADPAYTTLTRAFAPYMHAAANWILKTTAANEMLQIDITSGVPISQQPLLVGVWKLHDAQQSTTQHPNILFGLQPTTYGVANCVALTNPNDVFWSIDSEAVRYRVTASAGTGGRVEFGTLTTPDRSNYVFAGTFTHELVVKISSIPGESLTGDVTLFATLTTGAVVVNTTIAYSATQTTYSFPIASGAINLVQIRDIEGTDRFEFEISLNVTN